MFSIFTCYGNNHHIYTRCVIIQFQELLIALKIVMQFLYTTKCFMKKIYLYIFGLEYKTLHLYCICKFISDYFKSDKVFHIHILYIYTLRVYWIYISMDLTAHEIIFELKLLSKHHLRWETCAKTLHMKFVPPVYIFWPLFSFAS